MDDDTEQQLRQAALSLDPRQIQRLLHLHKIGTLAPLLDLAEKKEEFLVRVTKDQVLEEPVLDYVTDLSTRETLFASLGRIIRESRLKCKINMTLFAIFMVAPIEQLKCTVKKLEEDIREDNQGEINQFFSQCEITCVASIQAIANKGGRPSGSSANASVHSLQATPVQESPMKRQRQTHERSVSDSKLPQLPTTPGRPTTPSRRTAGLPTTPSRPTDITQTLALSPAPAAPQTPKLEAAGTPKTSRSREVANCCKKRDGMRCMITKMEDPQAAHIFPFAGLNSSKIPNIVSTLRTFWGEDTTTRLSKIFFDQKVAETPQNFISLNSQLHVWFDNGRMALKPLRELADGTVQVQLHWLNKSTLKPTEDCNNISLAKDSAGIRENQSWGTITAHRQSGLPLETGQVFNLSALYRDNIPSFDLLQLSWNLLRVVAICGAAEPSDLSDSDDDDDYGYEVETQTAMYTDDSYAEMSRWARELGKEVGDDREEEEEEEEEGREEDPSYNGKSSF
ncbi:uncharacterized protein Triagg1_8900 [Trichoderma aggressivum f. europaeum]|uniref:HNH nuclease domain-containing protein n=1 Tax=Trichoderma aggressivum f. europaeum TaxID=173218 RepID=A0AAE1I9T0_9HYPO|nr:hypothetical protein Triagg1_8900 [Trichoderma aggressivum f. europaeum]